MLFCASCIGSDITSRGITSNTRASLITCCHPADVPLHCTQNQREREAAAAGMRSEAIAPTPGYNAGTGAGVGFGTGGGTGTGSNTGAGTGIGTGVGAGYDTGAHCDLTQL